LRSAAGTPSVPWERFHTCSEHAARVPTIPAPNG
jgi:hypothetical protein